MPDAGYDVVVVGGSFAGLATAMQLRGYRVLVVDQRPIGAHQTSTCAAPMPAIRAVGIEGAILEAHDALVLHTAGRTFRYPVRDPYATLDYAVCCQAMLAQTTAEVWLARATGVNNGVVETTRGPVVGRFVVDASGWQSLARDAAGPARARQVAGYGVETEMPVALGDPGLHFYFEKSIVRHGYAWVFGCGASTRLGLCTFDKGVRLGPLLERWAARFGLQVGRTHGGVLAVGWRPPPPGEIFVVGDAGGQCLPLTGEGIRTALYNGIRCGRTIAAVLAGDLAPSSARTGYLAHLQSQAGFHAVLLRMERAVAATPDPVLAVAGWLGSRPPLTRLALTNYFTRSGWLAPDGEYAAQSIPK